VHLPALLSTTTTIGHAQFLDTRVHGRRDGCDRLPVALLDHVGQELGVDHRADAITVDWHPCFWVHSQRDGRDSLPLWAGPRCLGSVREGEGVVDWPRQLIESSAVDSIRTASIRAEQTPLFGVAEGGGWRG